MFYPQSLFKLCQIKYFIYIHSSFLENNIVSMKLYFSYKCYSDPFHTTLDFGI